MNLRVLILCAWSLALSGHAGWAQAPAEARSADGRWRIAAVGASLAIDDLSNGQRVKTLTVAALDGSGTSAVREIHALAPRRSVVVSFDTLAELWEISLDPGAEPIFDGFVHDYKMGEGIALPGFLNPRRTKLDAPLRGLAFDSSHAWVLGRAPDRADGAAVLQVWQLDIRRRIGQTVLRGDPDSAAARLVQHEGREWFEVPDRAGGPAVRIDPRRP